MADSCDIISQGIKYGTIPAAHIVCQVEFAKSLIWDMKWLVVINRRRRVDFLLLVEESGTSPSCSRFSYVKNFGTKFLLKNTGTSFWSNSTSTGTTWLFNQSRQANQPGKSWHGYLMYQHTLLKKSFWEFRHCVIGIHRTIAVWSSPNMWFARLQESALSLSNIYLRSHHCFHSPECYQHSINASQSPLNGTTTVNVNRVLKHLDFSSHWGCAL